MEAINFKEQIWLAKNICMNWKMEMKHLEIYWHPLTIAERESIVAKSGECFWWWVCIKFMITKALDKDGKILR